jgi:hypothetical protein
MFFVFVIDFTVKLLSMMHSSLYLFNLVRIFEKSFHVKILVRNYNIENYVSKILI